MRPADAHPQRAPHERNIRLYWVSWRTQASASSLSFAS